MKKAEFPEQQIAFALRQAETGTKVEEIIRQISTSSQAVLLMLATTIQPALRRPGTPIVERIPTISDSIDSRPCVRMNGRRSPARLSPNRRGYRPPRSARDETLWSSRGRA